MALVLSMREESEFKQMILLAVLLIWLFLEHFFLDTESTIKFRIIRLIYWMFVGVTRIDILDNPDTDDFFWQKVWKTFKVWLCDLLSMSFLIFAFGRSLLM
jgi:hypothetical protein